MVIKKLACVAAVVLGTTSLSAEPLPSEIVLARRLFAEARAAEDARDWPSAMSKLRGAVAVKETAGLRFHLAYCEEQQGMLVEALGDYERSEDLGKQTKEDFVAQLAARRDALYKRIPTVTVLTPPAIAEAAVSVDGRVVPSTFLGKPLPLNPGPHKLRVSAPGRIEFSSEIWLKEGDALVTSATMPPSEVGGAVSSLPADFGARRAASESAISERQTSSPGRTYALLGEAALALGALAVGIAYTLAASSADGQADDVRNKDLSGSTKTCKEANPPPACERLQHLADLAENDRFIALLGFIGAGVSTAALAGTFVLWPGGAVKASIAAYGAPGAAGLSVVGRF
jgi:tetratricopeptide (TPR) repeat protein